MKLPRMDRLHKLLTHLMRPKVVFLITLTLISVPLIVYVLLYGKQYSPLAYVAYFLSAYTLFAWCVRIPALVRLIRAKLHQNRVAHRYFTDITFRVRTSLITSTCINTVYAIFKLVTGIIYRSIWFTAVGIYYMPLVIVRLMLLYRLSKGESDIRSELIAARRSGWLLLLLNIGLTGMTVQMVHQGRYYEYPEFIIFAVAAYAFYSVIHAVVSLVRYRRIGSPVITASKIVSLATALVSMLSLQTSMIAAFGDDFNFQAQMNSLTGGAVCFMIFIMAIWSIVRSDRAIKRIDSET